MSKWLEVPFSDAVLINPTIRLKQGQIYPFVDMASVDASSRCVFASELREFSGGGSRFLCGDTLMARITPCLENGKIARFCSPDISTIAHGSTEFIVIRGKEGVSDNDFAYYLTKWEYVRSYAISQMTGTSGRQRVPVSALDQLIVPLPPLGEQQAIASILSALDDKIDLIRRMNETLEAMARTIFKDWFVDFGPTRAKMEGREAYLAPEIWALFPDRLDGEGRPEGWKHRPLSEFFSIIGGGTPKTSVHSYWGGEIPWFSVVDTPAKGGVFVLGTEKSITQLGLDESSARMVPAGVTIISARGTVGNLAIAGRDMTFNQSCYALHGSGEVGDFFVYLAAQHLVAQLQSMAHGSVFSTITRKTFEAVSIPKPGGEALRGFETVVMPLFSKIKANAEESRTLTQARDLLLPKLMSGEVQVNELEKHVGGQG
jgi:type I restriction enzyme S subunit